MKSALADFIENIARVLFEQERCQEGMMVFKSGRLSHETPAWEKG